MILQTILFHYPTFKKLELVCQNFDGKFAHKLYKKGWKYQKGTGIFFKYFYNKVDSEKLLEALLELKKKKLLFKNVNLVSSA